VLVPSHNEEALLPRCLESVQRARRLLPADVTSDVVVAIDDSHDESYRIAKRILGDTGCVVKIKARCVGRARECAASIALERYPGSIAQCWLANTDADCIVPASWLRRHLDYAQSGWTAVAGVVDVDSFAEHADYVEQRFHETYITYADGSHPHVHGANIGFRADAYLRAGGWADLRTAEDHHLWNRLRDRDSAMLSDRELTVITSGRRLGRAPEGFAAALAAHNASSL
jgi:glycosyltransferase involved in cell wall biosynthesis